MNKSHPESTPKAIAYYKDFDGEKESTSSKHSLRVILHSVMLLQS